MLIYNVCTYITQLIGHLPLKYDTYHVFSTPFSLILQHFYSADYCPTLFFVFSLCGNEPAEQLNGKKKKPLLRIYLNVHDKKASS